MKRCPICQHSVLRSVLSLPSVTINIGDLYSDQRSALRAPRGDIELAVCEGCGLVRNVAFDPSRIEYGREYENSQMFSTAFREFASALASDLVERYHLIGGRAVEIGCGKGEFLKLLQQAGVASAVGYDPTYNGEVDQCKGIHIESRLFDASQFPEANLLLSRHVFEHLEDPLALLREVRRALDGTSVPLYTEVPNARFVMAGDGTWDVIYPHVSYFTDLSMTVLMQRAGFRVESLGNVFGDQFLAAHARPSEVDDIRPNEQDLEAWIQQVEAFGERFRFIVADWMRELQERAKRGPICLWGAGAKGAAFLGFTGGAELVEFAVDINPRKQGKYLPGTGHEIIAPQALRERRPETVLVMNPHYEREIRIRLYELGLKCETLCV